MSLSLISGVSLAYTDVYGGTGNGNVSLARLFAPPAGSSSWNHGVRSFSKFQVTVSFAKGSRQLNRARRCRGPTRSLGFQTGPAECGGTSSWLRAWYLF